MVSPTVVGSGPNNVIRNEDGTGRWQLRGMSSVCPKQFSYESSAVRRRV